MEKDNQFGTQANGVNEDKQGGLLKKEAQHCEEKMRNEKELTQSGTWKLR